MGNSKWKVGEIEIFPLVELEIGGVIQYLVHDAVPEIVREMSWLQPDYADENGNLRASTQAFLIKTNDKCVLVDACVGNDKIRESFPPLCNLNTGFLSQLHDIGVRETDINYVVYSHFDFDHIGWSTVLKDGKWTPTFPNAKYIYVEGEYNYWKSQPENEMKDYRDAFNDSVEPVMDAGLGVLVSNDFKLDDNISFLPTPGHTPNHVSIVVESNGEKAIIVGDLMHHPCQFSHPEWSTLADRSPEESVAARAKVLDEIADKSVLFISSHFSAPSAGYVTKDGGAYKFNTL